MKQSIKQLTAIFPLIITITFFFSGCEKNESDSPDPITQSGATLKTTVTGRITDTNGNIVSGVTVKLGSITTVSDSRGYFLFVNADVPKNRFVLVASKTGYFNCVSGKKTQSGEANYINLMMQLLPPVINIQSSVGGIIILPGGGATITFPGNAFVDQGGTVYSGQVSVYARHINPGAANFEAIVPGGDLLGVNTMGEEQSLYSLGMIEAKLYDNTGNELKLAPGITAALKFPIDPAQASVALSTVPMWHLDEATGVWQEEGQGTKTGNFYIANVSHFSIWNCDYSGPRCDIQGMVVDCQNNAMPNIVVTINNFLNVITDNTGSFTTWVPVGYLIECQVLQVFNPVITNNSPIQSVTAVAGQVNIIPTIIVPCATRVSGSIKNCGATTTIPGFVYATWNGGSCMQYTNDGSYNLYVAENSAINIIASSNGNSGSTTINSGPLGNNFTVPDIQLCNPVSIGENKFTINDNGSGSVTYTLTNITSNSTFFIDSSGNGSYDQFIIGVSGTSIPGNFQTSIQIVLSNPVNETFPLQQPGNSIMITMDSAFYFSGSQLNTTSNNVIFSDYGVPGSFTSGSFEFDLTAGSSITNGEFSVLRDN